MGQLVFKTNFDQTFGPYGDKSSGVVHTFTANAPDGMSLSSIQGSSGPYLNGLTFNWSTAAGTI